MCDITAATLKKKGLQNLSQPATRFTNKSVVQKIELEITEPVLDSADLIELAERCSIVMEFPAVSLSCESRTQDSAETNGAMFLL